MNRYEAGIRQHGTHRELAGQSESGGSPWADALGLDAIIVPGSRPAAYLDHAVTLARAAKCSLVILCSYYLHACEVKEYKISLRPCGPGFNMLDVPKPATAEIAEKTRMTSGKMSTISIAIFTS